MKKIIFIGIDGMDPKLTESMMDAGKLPNFARLLPAPGDGQPSSKPCCLGINRHGCNPGEHGMRGSSEFMVGGAGFYGIKEWHPFGRLV